MEKRVLTSLTDPFDMSLSAHLMLSTPLFRAVPVPSSWPEQRTLPRGAGAGMQGTGESEKAETSASEPVVDGALEAITEASSVNGGEITTDAQDVQTQKEGPYRWRSWKQEGAQ
jgi:hypothetical protein